MKAEQPAGYAIIGSEWYFVNVEEGASGGYGPGVSAVRAETGGENAARIRMKRLTGNAPRFPLRAAPLCGRRVMTTKEAR
jgi:hypothetical protein